MLRTCDVVWWLALSFSSSTALLVRRRLGGGAGGSLVHAGGTEVVLRALRGFFRWRHCGGGKEWATGLAKNLRQAWC